MSIEHSPAKQRRSGVGIGHNGGPPLTVEDLRCITLKEFAALTGLSFGSVKRLMVSGDGPPVVQLSAWRVGIRMIDLKIWQESRIREVV